MINLENQKAYLKEHLEFLGKYPGEVGSKIYEFEEEFKKYFKINYASACANGSAGLILALKAIGIKEGDEVMFNCNYFISDPNSIKIVGGIPIFIDLGENINSLSLEDIKNKITPKTKAIIIIHLYGYPIENTLEIINFAHEKNIFVIEDACQAIGAKVGEKYAGTLGDLGVFSFDTNKLVKSGEGGMIISNNENLIEKTRFYKNNCKIEGEFKELGYNFRFNDFSAIYAKYSLKNLENTINGRRDLALKEKELYFPSNIFPNFYNIILKKEVKNIKNKKDFYNLDLKDFKNFNKHLKNHEII